MARTIGWCSLLAVVVTAVGCGYPAASNKPAAAISETGKTNNTNGGHAPLVSDKYLAVATHDATTVVMSDGLKPREVVQAAYSAANAHQYALADKFLCKTARRISTNRDLQNYWDRWTNNGAVRGLKIEGENVRGTQAQVRLVIEYTDGSESDEIGEALVKEADGWRMDYPGDEDSVARSY